MGPDPATALFTIDGGDGEIVTATELSRGPWDPRACHGGPVSALLIRSVEQVAAADAGASIRWEVARSTVELVRPVPVLVPMHVTAEVERPGRNVSLVASVLRTVEGTEVARARTLRIRRAELAVDPAHARETTFSAVGAGNATGSSWPARDYTSFHPDAVELRFVSGAFDERGPAQVWCRLRVPIVDGEEPSGAQRAMAACDFGNGIAGELDPDVVTFLNPDLTVHFARPPEGEWIGLDARSHYGPFGSGFAESAVFDQAGRLGRAVQSLLLAPRG